MISKTILFLSCVLLLIIMFERIQNNIVFTFYFKYEVKESEVAEKLLFRDFLIKFNKSYARGEFEMRYQNFKENLIKIERLNSRSRHATYGVTKFSDWTREELAAMLLPKGVGMCEPRFNKTCPRSPNSNMNKKNKDRMTCCKQRGLTSSNITASSDWWKEENTKRLQRKEMCKCRRSRVIRNPKIEKIPHKLDWRERHAVGPILNQRRCAACWAFSIIGVMESRAFIQNYGFNQLSIQELIDCSFDKEKSKTGCHEGRAIVEALGYLCEKKFKVTTESNYPLTLAEEKCYRTAKGLRGISRFSNSCDMYKNEGKLLEELTRGPVVAMVYAELLFNYNRGVIAENCETTVDKLNHAVQIVGYDTTANPPYYILRNSWGADWGENGYAKLAIGGNQCGVAFTVAYFDVN
ncbi:cathepsin O-like [Choristoneura fumiferana]|uniref:cathepsin O-like n=1 Tax=Choristoneura fumiferana TaxID=7141 RepID=UPI003D154DF4